MDRHQAIRNTHPTVVTINGDAEAWDKDGKVVELDESLIKIKNNIKGTLIPFQVIKRNEKTYFIIQNMKIRARKRDAP